MIFSKNRIDKLQKYRQKMDLMAYVSLRPATLLKVSVLHGCFSRV